MAYNIDMLQGILKWKLGVLAKLYLWKYKPMIIGVTGNAGKTSTKEVVGAVVSRIKKVRIASGNLNNELGLPLTVIGGWDDEYYKQGPSMFFWSKVLLIGYLKLIFSNKYPEVLVLEYGADHPNDIKNLVIKYKPHISVVTTVGDVPVHVEYFKNADALADEKSNLVKSLSSNDFAILNYDDHRVLGMKDKTKARVVTYGFETGANIRASDIEYTTNEEGRPVGVTFKLNGSGHFVPVRIEGSLGKSQAWSSAAAAAVGGVLGMNLVQVSEALNTYHGPKGRLKIIHGINNSNIIDDTYNASPASTRLALETIRDLPALRKIAVLGDMLELGEYSEKSHSDIGIFVSGVADILVCVGSRSKAIAESAGLKLADENIYIFENSDEAKSKVKELIREHDLVLVKGSQGMRMEKIVEAIMSHPENKKDLLVRQSQKWLAK
ncbi:MAG: UDP-N-acetylmuramoyl-tripeptide--D-alanyl-D-alanine ligase [Candidatus Pacebacteria bacterium]|nr:UDP-N-acetylmuramoyl-tripeptide--D-alanyl-D-alanine ligase [Candidatus Paceibacterota bacterium]